jgi:hypothetical protein
MQHNLIEFSRPPKNVLAWWDKNGVWINAGWTVGIPLATAVEYAASFNDNPANGFYEHDGKVVLSHGCAKIDLSKAESNAILDLIQAVRNQTSD